MMDLLDKDFKSLIINMSKERKYIQRIKGNYISKIKEKYKRKKREYQ